MQYTVRSAAVATGISGDRLRTWERRYGVPEPRRSPTGRRLRDDSDLDVIRRMAALVDSGLSAASAAAAIHEEVAGRAVRPDSVTVDPRVAFMLHAATDFNELLLLQVLDAAEDSRGIEAAIEELVLPALVEAGHLWERSEITAAAEHILSETIRPAEVVSVWCSV